MAAERCGTGRIRFVTSRAIPSAGLAEENSERGPELTGPDRSTTRISIKRCCHDIPARVPCAHEHRTVVTGPDHIAGRTAAAAGQSAEMTVQVCPPRPPAIGTGSVAGHAPAERQLDGTDMPSSLSRTHRRHRRACQEPPIQAPSMYLRKPPRVGRPQWWPTIHTRDRR